MSDLSKRVKASIWYDRLYKFSVGVKGVDGAVELVVGIVLVVAPHLVHLLLYNMAGEAIEHRGRFMRYIAENIAHVDADIAVGGITVVTLFLLVHGIVKLLLVWALMKEVLWAYPYALVALTLFFLYQLYVCIVSPSASMILFTLFDAVIISVVWGEWRKLKGAVRGIHP